MTLPISVMMITLNEAHHMEGVLQNLKGWADQIFVVDSFSVDNTVDIALSHNVYVVQRRFHDFGDQWNFAISALPITTPWTMKLDPDERLSDGLKAEIAECLAADHADAYAFRRKLFLMGKPLRSENEVVRLWRTGTAKFTEVMVNERPVIDGTIHRVSTPMEHLDSPNLHHWFEKQNRYMTQEATARFRGETGVEKPNLFGTHFERRAWLKQLLFKLPGRYVILHLYHLFWTGAWRSGRAGWIWARLRTEVYRSAELKYREMTWMGREYGPAYSGTGAPHPGAHQATDQTEHRPKD
ncbi:MAG: glycosyltransferase family 2 protein [Pseudomonadota bacterium]